MDFLSKISEIAMECDFLEYGYVKTENLKYHPEVRAICEGNMCRNFGTSWACPPAVGSIAECRTRVAQYDIMMIFSRAYRIEDSFDFEGMVEGLHNFKQLVHRFQQNLGDVLSEYLILSNEGCGRCLKCTYPDAPCRFPQLLHHSLEGYGFIVSELAEEAGIRYNNGSDTVTYFGAILFNTEKN